MDKRGPAVSRPLGFSRVRRNGAPAVAAAAGVVVAGRPSQPEPWCHPRKSPEVAAEVAEAAEAAGKDR